MREKRFYIFVRSDPWPQICFQLLLSGVNVISLLN